MNTNTFITMIGWAGFYYICADIAGLFGVIIAGVAVTIIAATSSFIFS